MHIYTHRHTHTHSRLDRPNQMAILKTLEPSCQLLCSFPWILLIIVRVKYTSWDRQSRSPSVCMRATVCVTERERSCLFMHGVCMHSHALTQHVYLWICAFAYHPGTWKAYWWMIMFHSYLGKHLIKLKEKISFNPFWLTFPCAKCQILSRYFYIILLEKDKDSSNTVLNLTLF